jgi:hypothetical protein
MKAIYNVTLTRYITGVSVSNIMATKSGSSSTITFNMPDAVQVSGAPLGGRFKIRCVDSLERFSDSESAYIGIGATNLKYRIEQGCVGMANKVSVTKASGFGYNDNGVGYFISYIGKNEDLGQATIVSDDDTPLTGTNISYEANTTIHYSTNLLYEPIPFEWLRTYETKP